MNNKIKVLDSKLYKIKCKGYIKMLSDKYLNAGLLLEKELGIESNSFPVADIDGIEIKTVNLFSDKPITLFSCTCDGPDLFELNRFVERFGIRDHTFNDTKVLYIKLLATDYTNWGKFLKMKLHIDRKKKRIYIIVANSNGKIIEKRVFWNFETLDEIMIRKLKHLCLVYFRSFSRDYTRYCKFLDYYFLMYKNFDYFLRELELGNIIVNIKYGVYKSGNKIGKSYNHGTAFAIKKDSLKNLFENIT